MAALDRPTHAFDGTPVAGVKRAGRAAGGAPSGDPRSEGAPSRTRDKLRAEFLRRGAAPSDDTVPTDRPAPGDSPEPFDWYDTDTGVQAAVAGGAAFPVSPALTTDEITRIGPIVPMSRSTTIISDQPAPVASPGDVPLVVTPSEPPPLPELRPRPVTSRTSVKRRAKPRVRRVRRIVRSIDTWTVFKLSVLFYLVLYAILLVAGVLLWNLAYATGTIDNLEHFFESFGWETFRFRGGEIFHSAWIAGLFLVAAGTGLNVVMATVFNLIADLVGGVGVTVLEEEVRVVPDTDVGTRRRAT